MKLIAINGSPRKNKNTGILIKHALDGASAAGAETELIHLYDLNFKGCVSCSACKTLDSKSYGKCAYKDELTPVLEKIKNADAVIIASPIYFSTATGETVSFLERLIYPEVAYTKPFSAVNGYRKKFGLIFTMNLGSHEVLKSSGAEMNIASIKARTDLVWGDTEYLLSMNTYQFEDYAKVLYEYTSVEEKEESRLKQFPEDCKKAFELGKRLCTSKGVNQ
ncbi:MAG: flavodoxin family protein [Spirochaetes bacterium]|nr:flavodoxin family protein [Spirochaetota bacterium]